MCLLSQLREFNTAEISDALDACGIEGALLGIKTVSKGTKLIGPAYTVKYVPYEEKPNDFKNAGNYIDNVPPQAVIVIDNGGRLDCTTWGDILTQVAIIKKISGTVIHGMARDIQFIRDSNYQLFSTGIYMRSGKNRVYLSSVQCDLLINNITVKPNDIVFGDDNGVVIIPKNLLTEVITKALGVKKTEQAIISSVKNGMRLEEARKLHRYDMPWILEQQ